MKLSRTERWMLSNQLRILEALYPDEAEHHAHVRKAIERGYEGVYSWFCEHIADGESILTEDQSREVFDILELHLALARSYDDMNDTSGIDKHGIEFSGFDGNDRLESKMMGFVRFLREEEKYERLSNRDGYNSHMPMLDIYRRMVATWKELGGHHELAREDILKIVDSRKYPGARQ